MKLMTKAILNAFAKQGDTSEKQPDQINVIVKFFNPMGNQKWYCYEYDPERRMFYAFVLLNDPILAECGEVSLDELESVNVGWGLKIERDTSFRPTKLSEVKAIVQEGKHI